MSYKNYAKYFGRHCRHGNEYDDITQIFLNLDTVGSNLFRIDSNIDTIKNELNIERNKNITLNKEISNLNIKIDNLNKIITELLKSNKCVSDELKQTNVKLLLLETLFSELKEKITKIFTFIPNFVKSISLNFLKLGSPDEFKTIKFEDGLE